MTTQVCTRCKEEKAAWDFPFFKRQGKLGGICKECRKKYPAEWRTIKSTPTKGTGL